jgi:hypothetical protein
MDRKGLLSAPKAAVVVREQRSHRTGFCVRLREGHRRLPT